LESELSIKNSQVEHYRRAYESASVEISELKKRMNILENASKHTSPFSQPSQPPPLYNVNPFLSNPNTMNGPGQKGTNNGHSTNPLASSSDIRRAQVDADEEFVRLLLAEETGKTKTQEELDQEFIRKMLMEEEKTGTRGPQDDTDEETRKLIESLMAEDRKRLQVEAESKEYDCPICFDNFTIERMFVLDNCFHKYCRDCLSDMMHVKINEGIVTEIKCPDPNCGAVIDHVEIKRLVDVELYKKYEDFTLNAALSTIEGLRWCPKPGCGNAMIGSSDRPLMHCSNEECRFTFCFNCKEEWHADSTCEQYQQWKLENSEADARMAEWAKNNAKACPKCQCYIEKNGGCNHMTCKSCKHEFCWLCNTDYKSDHFSTTSCTQYS
jgi:hypothetical protein